MVIPSQGLVTAAAALSAAGRYSMLWLAAAGLGVALGSDRSSFVVFVLAVLAEWVLTNGPVKLLFRRDRPDNSDVQAMVPTWLHPPRSSSFPSGHSSAAAFATVIWWAYSPVAGVAAALAALLMGLSRIVLRAHHPTDVVAGLLWGAALAGLSLAVFGGSLPS
ncbi:MAG: phosphatase PAP2 family protein [Acidimicrobiales bacterium]|nr:phosphatase PAP2 family protein [Acidimicrobiales bacterium]